MNTTSDSSDGAFNGIELKTFAVCEEDRRTFALLLVGLSTALFVVLSVLGNTYAAGGEESFDRGRFLVDTLLVASAFAAIIALRVFARPLSTKKGIYALMAVAFVGSTLCPAMLSSSLWYIGAPLVAVGLVSLVFLWWTHACTMGRTALAYITGAALIFVAVALIAIYFIPEDVLPLAYVRDMAALVSCLLLLGVENERRTTLLKVSIAESRERRRDRAYSRLGELNYFSIGALLGVDGALWLIIGKEDYGPGYLPPLLLYGVALVAVAFVMLLMARFASINFERYSKDYLSVSLGVGYLALPLLTGLPLAAVYTYLVAIALLQLFIIYLAGAELVRFEELAPAYSFSEMLYVAAGTLVGAIVVRLIASIGGPHALTLICGVALLYMMIVQVQLNKISFPEDWVEDEEGDTAPEVLAAKSPSPYDAPKEGGGSWDELLAPAGSPLRMRLDEVAQAYRLSPRQAEIFNLLARGRDVQYIMDYFTISRATAKSHVYNIYRKLDIHSRQELYDLIEQRDAFFGNNAR